MHTRNYLIALLLIPFLAVSPRPASGQSVFYGIGDLPGGAFYSEVRDATKVDGVIIAVGNSSKNPDSLATQGDTGILWTSTGGLVALPDIVPNDTATNFVTASAITRDGRVIASRARDSATGPRRIAVLVTDSGTINRPLGSLPADSPYSAATGLSHNGKVVYGFSRYDNTGNLQAVRWTAATGMVALGFLNGDTWSTPSPRAVSNDGSVMLGTSLTVVVLPGPGNRAFRYVHGSGMVALALLDGGSWNASLALTPDGNLALGVADSAAYPNGELVQWNARTGTTKPWGSPDPTYAPNNFGGLTADGKVGAIVFYTPTSSISYVRNAHGWFTVDRCLTDAGIDLTGWVLDGVQGVSPDGTLLFGTGQHAGNIEGWVAEVPREYLRHYRGTTNDEEDEERTEADGLP
jgi:hypothetical protein